MHSYHNFTLNYPAGCVSRGSLFDRPVTEYKERVCACEAIQTSTCTRHVPASSSASLLSFVSLLFYSVLLFFSFTLRAFGGSEPTQTSSYLKYRNSYLFVAYQPNGHCFSNQKRKIVSLVDDLSRRSTACAYVHTQPTLFIYSKVNSVALEFSGEQWSLALRQLCFSFSSSLLFLNISARD